MRREFLHVQYKRARRFVDPGYCLGTIEEEAACLACTACETPEEMAFLTDVRRKHEADADGFDARRKLILKSAESIALGVRWTERVIGLPRKYPALVLASCLMRADQALTPFFWRYREAWAPGAKETCWLAGEDGLVLDWLPEGLALLRNRLSDADFLADVNGALAEWGELLGEIPAALRPKEEAREWNYVFRSPFLPDIDRYAKARGLRFTLKKTEGMRGYEMSKDSLKKRLIKTLTAQESEGPEGKIWILRVQAGIKFSAEEFQRDAFAHPSPEEWVRTSAFAAWLPADCILAAQPGMSGNAVGAAAKKIVVADATVPAIAMNRRG